MATGDHLGAVVVHGRHVGDHVHGNRAIDDADEQEAEYQQPESGMLAKHLPAHGHVHFGQ